MKHHIFIFFLVLSLYHFQICQQKLLWVDMDTDASKYQINKTRKEYQEAPLNSEDYSKDTREPVHNNSVSLFPLLLLLSFRFIGAGLKSKVFILKRLLTLKWDFSSTHPNTINFWNQKFYSQLSSTYILLKIAK